MEPLSVAVHACRRAQIRPGSSCTILGAGAIGLLCAMAARRAGCTHIAIADIAEARVDFAIDKRFADAGFVVNGKRASNVEDGRGLAKATAASIASLQLPNGATLGRTEYTFECTGVESCVQTAIYVSVCITTLRLCVLADRSGIIRQQRLAAKLFSSAWVPRTLYCLFQKPALERSISFQPGDTQTATYQL